MIGVSPIAANPLPGNEFGSAAVSGCSGVWGGRSECGGVLAKVTLEEKRIETGCKRAECV